MSREGLLHERKEKQKKMDRSPLVFDFHPALSGEDKILNTLWPVLHASDNMKETFPEKPLTAYRRPKNLKNELVRSMIKDRGSKNQGKKKCAKKPCQIRTFVDEGDQFEHGGHKFYINHSFDCDSRGVVYLIKCK